ncbi:MAG TPA: DUF998 domain-containing protein [Pseudonocardiaceae bacterium]|nr:DUF998 domain-containing protein [Pseudonocardiaceae bacterium]
MRSRPVPWWVVLSSACAPVLLIGGWQLAAARQPGGFDPVRETISALASRSAADPWIMTAALAGVGACHTVTAAGLAPAAVMGRALLATGGMATIVLAGFPQPVTGDSAEHVAAASVALSVLSLWPAFAWRRGGQPKAGIWWLAATGLLGLLGWFGMEYFSASSRIGLSERVLTAAQALWPFAAVLMARRTTPAPDRG